MKVYCAYCKKELEREERLFFCKTSHKVNYHRGLKGLKSIEPDVKPLRISVTTPTSKPVAERKESVEARVRKLVSSYTP